MEDNNNNNNNNNDNNNNNNRPSLKEIINTTQGFHGGVLTSSETDPKLREKYIVSLQRKANSHIGKITNLK
jgi:uncharacterized phage protein gp47/JayE